VTRFHLDPFDILGLTVTYRSYAYTRIILHSHQGYEDLEVLRSSENPIVG
jgi:hypothetical protein